MTKQVRDELEVCELTWDPAFLATGDDPDSYEEAINSVDRDKLLAMTGSKMESILSVGTFELVPPPRDCKPIGSKCVFSVKYGLRRDLTLQSQAPRTRVFSETRNRLHRNVRTGHEDRLNSPPACSRCCKQLRDPPSRRQVCLPQWQTQRNHLYESTEGFRR